MSAAHNPAICGALAPIAFLTPISPNLPGEQGGEGRWDKDGGEDERHRGKGEQHDEDGGHVLLVWVLTWRRDADLAHTVAALGEPASQIRRAGFDLPCVSGLARESDAQLSEHRRLTQPRQPLLA